MSGFDDSMRLSTLEIMRVVFSVVGPVGKSSAGYQKFVSEVMGCGLIVGDEYAGWSGIDSKLCVVLIHLAVEHSKEDTFELPSFTKKVVSRVYALIYLEYEKACRGMGLSFVPCMKGLSTILKRAGMRR